jgi:hypothetical protein
MGIMGLYPALALRAAPVVAAVPASIRGKGA